MKLTNKRHYIQIIENAGFRFHHFIGDPRRFKLINLIEKYANEQLEIKTTTKQLQVMLSILLTLRNLQIANEKKKANTPNLKPIEVYAPASARYYTSENQNLRFCIPKIEGVGLTSINRCIWILSRYKPNKRKTFHKTGLGILELLDGTSYTKPGPSKFRRIYLKPVSDWGIWDKKFFKTHELYNVWLGFLELSSPISYSEDKQEILNLKREYGACIINTIYHDQQKLLHGLNDQLKSKYPTPAPVDKKQEIDQINRNFPKELSGYSYFRSFRYSTRFGGRLYGAFTIMPKKIRERLINRLDLVEVDIKNCATNILHTIVTGEFHDYDFYEQYAITVSKKIFSSNPPSNYSIFHTEQNKLHTSWREIFKGIVTRAIGSKTEAEGMNAIKCYLRSNGVLHHDPAELYATRADYEKWQEFTMNKLDFKAPHHYIPFEIFMSALNEMTESTIRSYLFSDNSLLIMNIESNALIRVLQEMIFDNHIPLACHDAVYVNKRYYKKYMQLFPQILKEEVIKRRRSILVP